MEKKVLHISKGYPGIKSGAFTLIEILIVVAITALLSGMVLAYSSKGRSQTILYVESAKLAQVILRAKSLAVATFVGAGDTPPCGYGAHIDYSANPAFYSLFSYAPAVGNVLACNGILASGIDVSDPGYKAIDTFYLPNEVAFDPSNLDMAKDVFFMPPDPKTIIWDSSQSRPAAPIRLSVKQDLSSSITINVSSGGQISF